MQQSVLYNILFEPFQNWWLAIYFLVGVGLVLGPNLLGESQRIRRRFFWPGLLLCLVGIGMLAYYVDEYILLRQPFRNGHVELVEGCARTRANDRVSEWLIIGDRQFLVGSPVTESFSRPSFEDGPSLNGRFVAIYVAKRRDGGDAIVWLAIRHTRCRDQS